MKLLLLLSLVLVVSCTEAQYEKATKIGSGAHIICYSGGKTIYDGYSTGAVGSEAQSDGYFFKDKKTKRLMEVSGNCVLP